MIWFLCIKFYTCSWTVLYMTFETVTLCLPAVHKYSKQRSRQLLKLHFQNSVESRTRSAATSCRSLGLTCFRIVPKVLLMYLPSSSIVPEVLLMYLPSSSIVPEVLLMYLPSSSIVPEVLSLLTGSPGLLFKTFSCFFPIVRIPLLEIY